MKGTPYYRLQHRRATFDGVIALRAEGVSISSISRIKGIAWNTVARWLEKAAVPSIYSSASPWVGSRPCGAKYSGFCANSKGV